jgi:chemotaxis protein methyltransferase CheR
MSSPDLKYFMDLLRSRTGIVLDESKAYLVNSRLAPIAGTSGYDSVDALLAAIRTAPVERIIEASIDAMTTNETLFFRDQTPFDHLRRMFVDLGRNRQGPIRLWSAACSTGQEPYSIAMLWEELAHLLPGVRLEILATDLSRECLTKAQVGVYSSFEVQRGLPVQKLMKHFERVGESWRIKPDLRSAVSWRQFNLLESPVSLGRFDIVFCRNVLIYFDTATRTQILERVAGQVVDNGYLILGGSETVIGVTNAFQAGPGAGLYVKASGSRPQATALAR